MSRVDVPPADTGNVDDADRLATAVSDFRRIARRTIRQDWPYDPLSPAQLDLLRSVLDNPGVGVREAAEHLRLAPNTVSTLVGTLTDVGLVTRTRDERDRRACRLEVTPAARRRLAAWRNLRARVIGAALHDLEPVDREAIARAVPAIERLTWLLEHGE
jgi:DNA-binding MarR family transcriptional regulator